MRALVLVAQEQLEVRDIPCPEPDRRALIAIERVGVCGTDLKIHCGEIPVAYPRVLGHELVGRVERPGPAGVPVAGTRVLVDPAISCGACTMCRADRANLCPRGSLMGRDVDGGFAEYLAVDERQLLPLPEQLTLDEAGMLQVLGVCVRAQSRVAVFPGQTAVVIGLGVGGLLHLQLLLARGVQRVVGVTRSAEKRALAERLGASATCAPDQAEACVQDLTGGLGADLVVEAAGKVETLAQAISLAGGGAKVLLYGVLTADEGRLPFSELYFKELDLIGSRAALARDYARAIDLVADGRIAVEPLLSGSYPLERGAEAFEALASRPELVKLVLDVGARPC